METQPNPWKKRNYRRIGKVSSYDIRRIHSSLHPTDAPDIRHHSSLGNNCLFPVEDRAINPKTGTHIYQICNVQPSSCIPRITKRDPTIRYGIYKLLARSGAHARTPVPDRLPIFQEALYEKKLLARPALDGIAVIYRFRYVTIDKSSCGRYVDAVSSRRRIRLLPLLIQ